MTKLLERSRKSIDNLDAAIVRLLAERSKILAELEPHFPLSIVHARKSGRADWLRNVASDSEVDLGFVERVFNIIDEVTRSPDHEGR